MKSNQHDELRASYAGGFPFLVIESALWFAAAALGNLYSARAAILTFLIGGVLIAPVAEAVRSLLKLPELPKSNGLKTLSIQLALTIPLSYPLVAAACSANVNWLFPAFCVIVGAHFLPFVYLYQMRIFYVVAAFMVLGGTAIGYLLSDNFSIAGYFGGAVLFVSATIIYASVRRENRREVEFISAVREAA